MYFPGGEPELVPLQLQEPPIIPPSFPDVDVPIDFHPYPERKKKQVPPIRKHHSPWRFDSSLIPLIDDGPSAVIDMRTSREPVSAASFLQDDLSSDVDNWDDLVPADVVDYETEPELDTQSVGFTFLLRWWSTPQRVG